MILQNTWLSKVKMIKFIILPVIIILTIMLSISLITFVYLLSGDKIHDGIEINGLEAGKLSVDELKNLLETKYSEKINISKLILSYGQKTYETNISNISVKFDIDGAIKKAYEHGRSGTLINRLSRIMEVKDSGYNYKIDYTYDLKKVDEIIRDFENKILKRVKQHELYISNDKVAILSGHSGESINKTLLNELIGKYLMGETSNIIQVPVDEIQPEKIDIDDYYEKVGLEAADAYVKFENGKAVIISEVVGRSVDKGLLQRIILQAQKTEDTEFVIPIQNVIPERTENELKDKLFRDIISTWKTSFKSDSDIAKNRSQNIKIAASKINGTILLPGEVFSFNKVVGERTREAGYKDAYIFVNGKVIPDIGGGICQVSTTLYNAILPLGFDIIERRNHTYTVDYSALGMDATVVYGQIDFKFRNSGSWPIKILSSVTKNNELVFSIVGTDEGGNTTFLYESVVKKTIENNTLYIDDITLEEGKTKVKQNGSKGYIVDTYKIIKQGGNIVSRKKMYTSNYKPLEKQILRGTKK